MNNEQLSEANRIQKEINKIDEYLENLTNEYISTGDIEGIGDTQDCTVNFIHNFTLHFEVNDYPELSIQVRDLLITELTSKRAELELELSNILVPLDEDYTLLLSYWNANFGVNPPFQYQKLQSKLLNDLKTQNIFDKVESLYVFNSFSEELALSDWINLYNASTSGGINFVQWSSISGDGINGSIDTLLDLSTVGTVGVDNLAISFFVKESNQDGIGDFFVDAQTEINISKNALNTTAININTTSVTTIPQELNSNSFYTFSRTASGLFVYENGVEIYSDASNGSVVPSDTLKFIGETISDKFTNLVITQGLDATESLNLYNSLLDYNNSIDNI